jgi:HPt (histidine-containing phosphotransfer) domain-containing protein
MNVEALKKAGIDYDSGLDRFMGDASLYEMVLGLFLDDDSIEKAGAALSARDYSSMFEVMHGLKGVAGNEDMTALYKASSELVELLRGEVRDEAAVAGSFRRVSEIYNTAKLGIINAREV